METKDYTAIEKFMKDSYSRKDYLKVIRQFRSDEEFDKLKEFLEQTWNETDGSMFSEESYRKLKSCLHGAIDKQRHLQNKEAYSRQRFITIFSRVAAILIIPLLICSVYFFIRWKFYPAGQEVFAKIYCPPGTRAEFNLPDGSTGWLNSDSYLRYPVNFTVNRHVDMEGEAYFNVAKDRQHPFVVQADGLHVQALGTHFNIMAYPDWKRMEVTLEEGAVQITSDGSGLKKVLRPDQRMVLDLSSGRDSVITGDAGYFTSWKEGYLVFRNVPLEEVAVRLGKWYNSDIVIEDDALKNIPYRATFKDQSLERVLSLLKITAPISYELIEAKTNKNGAYEKQKVIIRYKK